MAKCFVIFLMSFRNKAYNFHLTPLTLTPLTLYPLIVTCSVFDNE